MAKETLQQYLNRELDEKGVSSRNHKKNAGKYKSISAAKKADSLYYTNKDGKIMAAVFEKDLKEKPTEKKPAPKKTMRPRARNQVSDRVGAIIKTEPITVTRLSVDASAARKKSFKKKTPTKTVPKKDLKGAAWMKANTYAAYMKLSKSEARALGLPATRASSTQHKLRDQKFKDGKNFMGK